MNGKEKYAKIAEFAIGYGNLDRFVVTEHDDLQLMDRLRKEAGCSYRDCSLYKIHKNSTQQKYNTPAPPNGVETVTSVVSVDNAMAFNFLVDSCKIDESALADSKESSEDALLDRDNASGKHSIRGKVKKVYCLPNGDFWQVNKGLLNIVSNDRSLRQTIGVDRSAAIDSAKLEVQTIQQELGRNKRDVKAIQDKSKVAKREWNARNLESISLKSNISEMENLLGELKEEAETSEEVPTIDTSEYENDIADAEEEVDELKRKGSTISEEIESLQPEVEELKNKLDETAARNEKILEDLNKVEYKLGDIVKGQNRRQEVVDKCRAKVQERENSVVQQEAVVEDVKQNVANCLLAARRVQFDTNREIKVFEAKQKNGGATVAGIEEDLNFSPSDEDLASLIDIQEAKYDAKKCQSRVTNKLKKIENERLRRNLSEVDPAVARSKYLRAKKNLDSKMKQIDAIDENVNMLLADMKERRRRWKEFRGHIAQMTNISFDDFLQKKNASGQIEFDHENQQLNLIFQKVNSAIVVILEFFPWAAALTI